MYPSVLWISIGLFGNLAFSVPAVHIDGQGCFLADGSGNFILTSTEKAVITQSGNGNLVCKANVAPPPDGKAVHYDFDSTGGARCRVYNSGYTAKWHEVVSASGQATLTCHFK